MDAAWFPGRLRELREAAGMTQQQLADKAALDRVEIARLETGARAPAYATFIRLCKALAVSCEALMARPTTKSKPRRGRPPRKPPDAGPADAAGDAVGRKKPRRRKQP